jgi:hypothetical protein
VLIQVAMIAFALCAMLSMIVDIGYARISQAQMQNAVDTAAIEGMRKRDAGNEASRRAAAGNFVSYTFDDDFDTTDIDDYNFGAGPIIDLTDGITTLHGAQVATVPDLHVYKPTLQANLDNESAGDMVSGRFCYNADPAPAEGSIYANDDTVCGQAQLADGSYARNDFNPGGANANAFLVRMRRSNDYVDQDGQIDQDVGSSGPSLPLTFGKATTIFSDSPDGSYSVRRDGLTVRATAIAETRPVLHLGTPQAGAPQMAPFILLDACEQSATGAVVTIPVTINPNTGVMTRTNTPGTLPNCGPNTVVGRFFANPAIAVPTATSATVRTVGDTAPTTTMLLPCQLVPATLPTRYVAIYSAMASGPNRVIGFAGATFTRQANCPGPGRGGALPNYTATITRTTGGVAPSNATALLVAGFPAGITPAQLTELLDKNTIRGNNLNYAPVLAPMLAR